jgi:hypothetical protein
MISFDVIFFRSAETKKLAIYGDFDRPVNLKKSYFKPISFDLIFLYCYASEKGTFQSDRRI